MTLALTWSELDPRTHAFDLAAVRPTLEAIVTGASDFRAASAPRQRVERELARAIVEICGPWASGWDWSPSNSGPAAGWCCTKHSVFRDDDRDALDTAARALEGLASWRAFLVELDLVFARLRIETAAGDVALEVERAASQLLALVVQRTSCSEAWYGTFSQVLRWYLEAAGLADATIEEVIDDTIEGRFESWTTPEPAVARETAIVLGTTVAARIGHGEPRDALADWRRVREHPIELDAAPPPPPEEVDAHRDYIATRDHGRDPQRATAMLDALLLCRDSAARGLDLSFDQLAEWQAIVLRGGHPEPFRTTDAFAKRGREWYRFAPDVPAAFERALADAHDPELPVAVRAARAYLDVCFFHPFADGNARAARLALDHVLTRAGLALRVAEPVFSLARAVDDPAGVWALAIAIERSTVGVMQKSSGAQPGELY